MDNKLQDRIRRYLREAIAAERSFEINLRRHAVRADDLLMRELLLHGEESRGVNHTTIH